jgi:hypothetical protein
MYVLTLPPVSSSSDLEEDPRKKKLEDLCQQVVEMVLYGVFPSSEK